MRGTGDHTWVDLEVMTQQQYERYEEKNSNVRNIKKEKYTIYGKYDRFKLYYL